MPPIDPPKIPQEELARLRATFALRRMAKDIQSSVLSDGTVASRLGMEVSAPISLPDRIFVERTVLFSAFRAAADGDPIPDVVDCDGVKKAMNVEIEGEDAVVSYGRNRILFKRAILLAGDSERRLKAAARIADRCRLSVQSRKTFDALTRRDPFTYDRFLDACNILLGAPDAYADDLAAKARSGKLQVSDLLPVHDAYWENIAARRTTSDTPGEFASNELADAVRAAVQFDLAAAIESASLSFAASELVPLEIFKHTDSDALLEALRGLVEVADPHALAGAFEICAERADDGDFVALGDRILDSILGDPGQLVRMLGTYAAAFIVATVHLSSHRKLRDEAVYWRRIVAAAHAALVTRLIGGGDEEESSLFDYVMWWQGKTFYLAVLHDAHIEPRWRPDWITPGFLAADIYGRLANVVVRLGAAAPASWQSKIESGRTAFHRIEGTPPIAHAYPSLVQGGRTPPVEMPLRDTPVGEHLALLASEPTIANLLLCQQLVEAIGFPAGARQSVLSAVAAVRARIATDGPEEAQEALRLAAHIAALNRDAELADEVASVALERLISSMEPEPPVLSAAILSHCAAASLDRNEAMATLARRLENMSYIVPAAALPAVVEVLQIMKTACRDLQDLLGRAMAAAKLGYPRISGS